MMQRMGMNMDSVPDVQQVVIKTSSKDIVIDEPEVAILEVQGQKMYQVIGGQVSEQAPSQRQAAKPAATYFGGRCEAGGRPNWQKPGESKRRA